MKHRINDLEQEGYIYAIQSAVKNKNTEKY